MSGSRRARGAFVSTGAVQLARLWRKPAILWPRQSGGWLARLDATVLLPPLIQTPVDGEHYALSRPLAPAVPLLHVDHIVFAVAVSNEVNRLDWFLDGQQLTSTRPSKTYVWRPQLGEHALVIVDDLGRTSQARFTVHEQVP